MLELIKTGDRVGWLENGKLQTGVVYQSLGTLFLVDVGEGHLYPFSDYEIVPPF